MTSGFMTWRHIDFVFLASHFTVRRWIQRDVDASDDIGRVVHVDDRDGIGSVRSIHQAPEMGNFATCRVIVMASVPELAVLSLCGAVDALAEEDDDTNGSEHGKGSAKEDDGTSD